MKNIFFAFIIFLFWTLTVFPGPHNGLPRELRPSGIHSPRLAIEKFASLCKKAEYTKAAYFLDLRKYPASRHKELGENIARKICYLFHQRFSIDIDSLSNEKDGDLNDGIKYRDIIGYVVDNDKEISLQATKFISYGEVIWVFSTDTVSLSETMYETYGPNIYRRFFPEILFQQQMLGLQYWQWIILPFAFILSILFGFLITVIFYKLIRYLLDWTTNEWDNHLFLTINRPLRLFFILLVLSFSLELLYLPRYIGKGFYSILQSLLIIVSTWILIQFMNFISLILEDRLNLKGKENEVTVRAAKTQLILIRRVLNIFIGILGVSLVFFQFDAVRKVGMSLLASAGVAGIVIGLAAQKSIASILSGIQLAMTRPIRIGDTLIVSGEYGTVEEINLTFVVLKVWDERRLIIPINHFLEKNFENWTKVSSDLKGTVVLYADYTVPIPELRNVFETFLSTQENWDKRVCGLQVTDILENSLQLRFLMSAENSSKLWDLRCNAREYMISFLQELDSGKYLPKKRVKLESEKPEKKGLISKGIEKLRKEV